MKKTICNINKIMMTYYAPWPTVPRFPLLVIKLNSQCYYLHNFGELTEPLRVAKKFALSNWYIHESKEAVFPVSPLDWEIMKGVYNAHEEGLNWNNNYKYNRNR